MEITLVMFKPDGQRRDFTLTGSKMVIGRGEECDLRVPVLSVSRIHCELAVSEDGELTARDLASSNGTYVNNNRVDEAVLKAGDHLTIGPSVFTVQVDGKPEHITPVKDEDLPDGEEVVDLEPDATVDASAPEHAEDDHSDPISALEALAAEGDKKEKQ